MSGDRTAKLILGIASAAFLVSTAAIIQWVVDRPALVAQHWNGFLLDFIPPALILASAQLATHERTPARYAVSTAALIVLFYRGIDLWLAITPGGPGILALRTPDIWQFYVNSQRAPVLLAITAFVPACTGWWQRRQDRLLTHESDA